MGETVIYQSGRLKVVEEGAFSARGARVVVRIGQESEELLEGPARHLHLALRGFVRKQKWLRGDTPRGRNYVESKEDADAGSVR